LVPALNQRIADDNLNLYFNEVIMGTLRFIKDVAFQTVLDWEKNPVDQEAFKEALAGVMTMLLGRSLVLVGDGFMTSLQSDMKRACEFAAPQISSRNDPFKAMGITASPELKMLLADTLRVGWEVFGPLPPDARRRLRLVLYDVMETLPPDAAGTLLEFIAGRDHLIAGTNTLVVVVIDPGGQRSQQVVSFGVTAARKKGASLPGARLPELPGRKSKGAPALPAIRIAEYYNRALIAKRLNKGEEFMTRHSAQWLRESRQKPHKSEAGA
jgi:hypothetical protein